MWIPSEVEVKAEFKAKIKEIMKYLSFEDMPVWKLAMDIAKQIFDITVSLPRSEDYGLTSQIRRSAVSISANLAEGFGRETEPDKKKFYIISRGSAFETKSHLIYGNSVNYFTNEQVKSITVQIDNLIHELNKLIKSLNNRPQPQPQP